MPGSGGGTAAGTAQTTPEGDRFPWIPLSLLAAGGAAAAYLANLPCRLGAWSGGAQYEYGCYTDIYPLYFRDRLDSGSVVYVDQPVEYPVLIGGLMHVLSRAVAWLPDPRTRGLAYFDATAAVLAAGLLVAALAVGYLAGRQAGAREGAGFDERAALLAGLAVALMPAGILTAYINWDLLAVALSAGALFALARGRSWTAGLLLGLAVAAKFYPVFFLGPLLVLALRDRWRGGDGGAARDFFRVFGAALLSWGAVNLPVLLASPEGWATFFTYSSERGADWGTIYYLLAQSGVPWAAGGDALNRVGSVGFLAACAGIGLLGLLARRRPPLPALLFLVVAAFILTNKVWSPQFVLWLLPLAALAWPRNMPRWSAVAAFACWQLGELGYVLGVWPYLAQFMLDPAQNSMTVTFGGYAVLTLGRFCGLAVMCILICVDCLRNGTSKP